MKNSKQGSVLAVVMLAVITVTLVVASVATLINTQRRVHLQKELQLQANNVAEEAANYTYSYVINEISTKTLPLATSVPSSGYHEFTLPASAQAFLTSAITSPSDFAGPTSRVSFSNLSVRVLAPGARKRFFVDPNDTANANDPNINQWIFETTIPIVARVTATIGAQSCTATVQEDIALREIPLFQHAIFFSGQLQLHRGYHPLGDIHSNGPLLINAHDNDDAKYTGFISTAGHFYRGSTIDMKGSGADAYGYTKLNSAGDLDFDGGVDPVATGDKQITIYANTSNGTDIYKNLTKKFDSRMNDWKDLATQTFLGHLQDASHQVPSLVPTGSDNYSLDLESTSSVNEFTNGPYSLIEPLLPVSSTAYKSADANRMNLEANASLIFRVEYDPAKLSTLKDAAGNPGGSAAFLPDSNGDGIPDSGTIKDAVNITDAFVVKAYKYSSGWVPGSNGNPTLIPVTLPQKAIGVANDTDLKSVNSSASSNGRFESYKATKLLSVVTVDSGLHDSRLGRGVNLLTIDLAALKSVMEADPSTLSAEDKKFRDDFLIRNAAVSTVNASNTNWNGIVYVELPTSLTISGTASSTSTSAGYSVTTTFPFQTGSPELRHPDRASDTDSRASRTDNIVPIAPELRRYPAAYDDATLIKPQWAIPAVQLINAKKLPNPPGSPGFSIATNAPLYLVGSYNSDGNYKTGTNITSTAIDAFAQADTDEIPSAIFADTLTVLSDNWAVNRPNSFYGATNMSSKWRSVPLVGSNRIEIGACIATGEYPIFEFFLHALEDFQTIYNTDVNPIIVKGSMVGMFHSEIQHIKQAYGRDPKKDIQTYYSGHGAFAIPTVRFHQFLVDGTFPPGTPMARVTELSGFRLLRPGDADDQEILAAAGF